VVDHKYNTDKPNILSCRCAGAPNFWKGVKRAADVTKMGYMWRAGNGRSIKFREDVWIGISNLAIQFCEIYTLVNENSGTISELWDGEQLKCTFRSVDSRLYRMWEEVVQIASTVAFSEECDSLIW
jgi:hypothetical protein